jgi:hypothetical protein
LPIASPSPSPNTLQTTPEVTRQNP